MIIIVNLCLYACMYVCMYETNMYRYGELVLLLFQHGLLGLDSAGLGLLTAKHHLHTYIIPSI